MAEWECVPKNTVSRVQQSSGMGILGQGLDYNPVFVECNCCCRSSLGIEGLGKLYRHPRRRQTIDFVLGMLCQFNSLWTLIVSFISLYLWALIVSFKILNRKQ